MRRIRECEVVDGESVSIDIGEAVEELRRREVELRVFLDIGELDGSTLCEDRSVINSVDGEGLGGKSLAAIGIFYDVCLLYTSPSPRDKRQSRMPSSA